MPIVVPSNGTGLAIAEEVIGSPGTLSSPTWIPLEPNTYAEFGGQTKLTPRNPITSSRQRKKGVVTDLDVAGGFNSDFVTETLSRLFQGFLFADWRYKTNRAVSAAGSGTFTVASGGTGFLVGSLVFGEGFGVDANNGLKPVTASTATTVTATGATTEASPPAAAKITRVGHQGASGDLVLTVAGGVATLESTALDFTTLGLIPGEWIWIGGDTAPMQFATAACNGAYRIASIAANDLVFDRTPGVPTADAGTGKTIRLFFGHVLKNEADASLQKLRTYTVERQLTTTQFEYIQGCAANTLAIDIKKADKITLDISVVGLTTERAASAKAGTRETLPNQNAFNSSTSFTRLRFNDDSTGVSLASYVDELKLTIDNGIDPVKAVSALGGIDINYGDFMVSGTMNAFFTTYAAVDAVLNNDDCSIDMLLVDRAGEQRLPVGWLIDVPLMALGDGRLKVEKDKPIMIPLSYDAAAHPTLDHTMMVIDFSYLPVAAL